MLYRDIDVRMRLMGNTKQKLRRGETALGGWVMIGHPTSAEIMAGEGFDFICVDMEHTSIDIRTFHEIALALKGTGCDLLARLDCCNASLAKRVLDMGADGIIVPSVNTPEMVRKAVRMATFPPKGTRGAALSRASAFGRNFSNYFASFNDNVLIVVMIEHVEAVENIDAILCTPGVDAIFIGPYDLSASMGLAGQLDHPDVRAAQQTILNACHRHNIPPGIHVVTPDATDLRDRLEQGFRFVACGIDTEFIMAGCRSMLQAKPKKPVHLGGGVHLPASAPCPVSKNDKKMHEVVLVTDLEHGKAEKEFRANNGFVFRSVLSDEQLLAEAVLSNRCRAVVVGVDQYVQPLYEALGKTGGDSGAIIARFGVGHDGIDKTLARKHNIMVTNTPGVLDRSVAEHTIWLIGALARNIAAGHEQFRAGRFVMQTGHEMAGKTLGIIGFGAIGRQVAQIAHLGFAMRVLAADYIDPDEMAARCGKSLEQLQQDLGVEHYTRQADEVFAQSDVVSIHLPAVAATRHFVNDERLGRMRPGALLVNTSRGSVIDEDALFDALTAGRIAGAALDVYESEPYRPALPEKDLRTLGNIVFTPHLASNTHEANQRMARACLDNLSGFFDGRLEELTRVDAII